MNGPKIYFTIPLFGGIGITQTTVSSFVVMLLLCIAAVVLGSNLQKRPSRRQVLVEKGVTMLYDMVESTMGKHNSYWTPYIGALFLSSICGSFIGMTGIFRSSTADLSTTFTWALMTSFLCWGCSIKRNSVGGWLKGFTEPIVVMTPMNLVSEIAQPISMAFRHFGNILSGTVISTLLYWALASLSHVIFGWLPGFLSQIQLFQIGIPAFTGLYFDWFGGCIQAFIFCTLTTIFIKRAAGED